MERLFHIKNDSKVISLIVQDLSKLNALSDLYNIFMISISTVLFSHSKQRERTGENHKCLTDRLIKLFPTLSMVRYMYELLVDLYLGFLPGPFQTFQEEKKHAQRTDFISAKTKAKHKFLQIMTDYHAVFIFKS